MRSVFLLALLVVVAPAWSQDQSLAPDGENGPANVFSDVDAAACSTSTACSATTCETDVDEGADAGGDDLDVCTETTNATIRFTLPTPSSDPDGSAGAQTIDLIMTCTDADTDNSEDCTGSPTFSVELYCGASAQGVLPFSGQAVTAPDQDHSTTFTYPAACATDGSDLEFHFTMGRSGGSPGSRRWIGIEAVEWEVTHAPAGGGPTRRRHVTQEDRQ